MPLWEYITYKIAERAGIRTPEVHLQPVAGKNVLLIGRFDRSNACCIPFISAMSLLKASDGDSMSYADMAAVIQACGASPAEDLRELWSRMVFNMCVYNVDDHLRNHGFLREPMGWRLSLVYDLETSHPAEKEPYLHTGIIEGMNGFSLENAIDAAELFRLSKSGAKKRLEEIRHAVSSWKHVTAAVKASPGEIKAHARCL